MIIVLNQDIYWFEMVRNMCWNNRHAVGNAWEAVDPHINLEYSDVRFSAQDCAVNAGIVFG